MNKIIYISIIAVIAAVLIMLIIFYPFAQEENKINLGFEIRTTQLNYSASSPIQIITVITNNGNHDVVILGNQIINNSTGSYNVSIYLNGELTFNITDSNGNNVSRIGGYHGTGQPYLLKPNTNLTVIADISNYYSLSGNNSYTIQARYSSSLIPEIIDYYPEYKNKALFDGYLESNLITITVVP